MIAVLVTACGSEGNLGSATPNRAPRGPVDATTTTASPASSVTTQPSSSTSAPLEPKPPDRCEGLVDAASANTPEAVPRALQERLDVVLAAPAWSAVQTSISIWVEGYGEIVAVNPDLRLNPASNQKIVTAAGVFELLEPDHRFRTQVELADGALVLRAGGDPTLTLTGPHSLDALAQQVAATGLRQATHLVVDAGHFEAETKAPGWLDWQVPRYTGPLSALTVDDNRHRSDEAFLRDPATANAELFAGALEARGVALEGPVQRIDDFVTPASQDLPPVGEVNSATVRELAASMLSDSDNEIAEAMVREIGDGSTTDGLRQIRSGFPLGCLDLKGTDADGSGLSRENFRSAREWRRILTALTEVPWADDFRNTLPVAGESGTLRGRLDGADTAGAVQAKTGTIIGGRALSGYATTLDGRDMIFSVITNGEPDAAAATTSTIDQLITTVVSGA